MSCAYMPYDFQNEVLEAMAETMLDNDKVKPELREKIKLYVAAKKLGDQMDNLMEGVKKSPSPASTETPEAEAADSPSEKAAEDDSYDDGE